jgi:hypothetical protein
VKERFANMGDFEVVGNIRVDPEPIASGRGIRELARLKRLFPAGRNWRKKKGYATIRYSDSGRTALAELHWYEAHGIGRIELKVKAEL